MKNEVVKSVTLTIGDDSRREIWDKYIELEYQLQNLKSIVQNPVPLSIEDLECHRNTTDSVASALYDLNKTICDKYFESNKPKPERGLRRNLYVYEEKADGQYRNMSEIYKQAKIIGESLKETGQRINNKIN